LNSFVPFDVPSSIHRDWRHLGGETKLLQRIFHIIFLMLKYSFIFVLVAQ